MSKLNLKNSLSNKLIFKNTIDTTLDVLQFDSSVVIVMQPAQTDVIDVSLNKTIKWKMWLDTDTFPSIRNVVFNFWNSNNSLDSFIVSLRLSIIEIATFGSGDSFSYDISGLDNEILNFEVNKIEENIDTVKLNGQTLTSAGDVSLTLSQIDSIGGYGGISIATARNLSIWDLEIYDGETLLNNIKGYPNPDTSIAWKDLITDTEANLIIAENHTPELKEIITSYDYKSKLLLKEPVLPNFTITLDQVNAEYVEVAFDNALSQDGSIWTFSPNTQPHATIDSSGVEGTFNTIQFKEVDGVSYSLSNNDTELTITSINSNQDASIILGDSIYYSYHLIGELDPNVTTVSDASFNQFLQDTSLRASVSSGWPPVNTHEIGKLGDTEWIMEASIGSRGGTGEWILNCELVGTPTNPYVTPFDIDQLQPTELISSNVNLSLNAYHAEPLIYGYSLISNSYVRTKFNFDYFLHKITVNHSQPMYISNSYIFGPDASSDSSTWIYVWDAASSAITSDGEGVETSFRLSDTINYILTGVDPSYYPNYYGEDGAYIDNQDDLTIKNFKGDIDWGDKIVTVDVSAL